MISGQKKFEGHKKNEQKEKDKIISLLSFEVPKRWPYANCCRTHSLHPHEAPTNKGGHPKQLKYHGPMP
jgi:hypothetical protein